MIATALWLVPAFAAGAGFYLASPHQRLLACAPMRGPLRFAAACATAASIGAASHALGFWPGAYAALTALMFAMVALPYLDAWHAPRGDSRTDVG